jgi:hypothetical protein
LYQGLVGSPGFGFSRRSINSNFSFTKTAPPWLTSSLRFTLTTASAPASAPQTRG